MALKIRQKSFRQKMKGPDEFISFTQKALSYSKENYKIVASGFIAIFIAIFLVGFFVNKSKVQKTESFNTMYEEMMMANLNYHSGKYDKAQEKFEHIIQTSEKSSLFNDIAQVGLGYTYINDKQYDKAIELFEELTAREDLQYPKEELFKILAMVHEDNGNNSKAMEIYKKLILQYPQSTEIPTYKHKISLFSNK